jgi:tetratricopeptide (TPR) repeat protein
MASASLNQAGLDRLDTLIEKRYPYRSHVKIYRGGHGRKYNFSALHEYLSLDHLNLNRDTLQKIFDQSPVREDSIKHVFEILGDRLIAADLNVSSRSKSTSTISSLSEFCNLPRREYEEFVGRPRELEALLDGISFQTRPYIVTVHGLGGVGKTALALEAAYQCLQARDKGGDRNLLYDTFVFVNFKQDYLYPNRSISRSRINNSALEEVFRTIAEVLKDESITRSLPEEQENRVLTLIRQRKVLIILDDLQSLTPSEVDEIQSFLQKLPSPSKVIVTTRELRFGDIPIRLDSLHPDESYQLASNQLRQKNLDLSEENKRRLCHCYWHVPQAIIYAIGQLNHGYFIDQILGTACPSIKQEATKFCFENSMALIRNKTSYQLLLAASVFHAPPTLNAIIEVSGISEPPSEIDTARAVLNRLSLVKTTENGRFSLDPMTREYTSIEFQKYPDIQENIQSRWINWCIKYTEKYGGTDWGNWHVRYDHLQEEWENILSILNWCAAEEKYEEVKLIWTNVNHFSDLYGHWNDRLTWLDWLIQNSRKLNDLATYVQCLSRKGWTLTILGGEENYSQAAILLQEAWELREHLSLSSQDYLAHNRSVLLIRQKSYEEASKILNQKDAICYKLAEDETCLPADLIRHKINTIRDRAKMLFKTGNFEGAHLYYIDVVEKAQEIGWLRMVSYGYNMLAKVLIERGELNEAENALKKCMSIAETNRNRRRLAFCHATYAELEKCRNGTCLPWCNSAIESFKQLGMYREIEALQEKLKLD